MTVYTPVDWTDAMDPTVIRALTVPCKLGGCRAPIGEPCSNLDGADLPGGRLVHHFRMDKLLKSGQTNEKEED